MPRWSMMTNDAASAELQKIKTRIETAAASATTRNELINLRALWGDINTLQQELDKDANPC